MLTLRVIRATAEPLPLLDGLSIVEVGEGLALAYAGKVLAAAGADVVKVEAPAGDPLRRWQRPEGQDYGPLFEYLNAAKRSVTLDLETEAGRAALASLAAGGSALLHSLRPAAAGAAGLTYAALSGVNPAGVVVALTPYGSSGPYAEEPATDLTIFALTSRLHHHGSAAREPIGYAPDVTACQAGLSAALATLGAVFEANLSGQGQDVDIAATEALTGNVDQWLLFYSYGGQRGVRAGAAEVPIYPNGIFVAADGYVLLLGAGAPFFERLCRAIGHPELMLDDRWRLVQNRPANRDAFMAILLPWLAERGRDEIVRILQGAGVLSAPVQTLDAALSDPQLAARGSLVRFEDSLFPGLLYPARPYLPSLAAPEPTLRAPHLGEHNAELLPAAAMPAPKRASAGTNRGAGASSRSKPLAGVRVIEITEVWAGPMACSLLGDLGADVIKVESYPRATVTRPAVAGSPQSYAGGDVSGRFYDRFSTHHVSNRNKRGIAINVTRPDGAAILKRLVAGADAFVEGYSAGTIDGLGLGYEEMRRHNPELVMVSMPGWGQKGPYQGYVTLGSGLDASSGHHALRGYRHGSPLDTPLIYHSDATAALFAAFAVIAGLRYRRRAGHGQYFDLSQSETLLGHLVRPLLQVQLGGPAPESGGNDHPDYLVQGCYPVQGNDNWIALSVRDERDWQALCRLVPALGGIPVPKPSGWVGPRDDLEPIDLLLADWTREQQAAPLSAQLRAHGIPAMPVNDEPGVFADPSFTARGFIERVRHPEAGERLLPGLFMRYSATPLSFDRYANLYGEHNDEVLHEAGYDDAAIAELRRSGIVGDRLPAPGEPVGMKPA